MYCIELNAEQQLVFTRGTRLELYSLGKPNKDGERNETCKIIANFWPNVTHRVEQKGGGSVTSFVKFTLVFTDGDESDPVIVPLQHLEKLHWANDVNLRCIINPDAPSAKEHNALQKLQGRIANDYRHKPTWNPYC